MTTVYLARHGESDWNAEVRWQGHADRPLTERGREQARALAERLAETPLDAVYASDLRRAWETAEAVAARQRLAVARLRDLREVDVGEWSGLTRVEAEERYPEGFRRWLEGGLGWERGESYDQMAARVLAALAHLAERHPAGHLLVVTHGGPIRAVHASALGIDLHVYRRIRPTEPNARLSAVAVEDGKVARLD